ncbi:MAG: hypothetical protein AAF830_17305 [Pseudomonadota bacterium]
MILRRLTEHVRTQNWFAVALDFVIVVIGVYMGIQLGNWNEERGRRAQEQSYLILVHEELVQNGDRSERLLAYYETVTAAAERGLAYLEGEEDCESGCEELLIDFFHASQLWAMSFDQTAFREAIELGFPSDNALREELFLAYDLTDAFGLINQTSPPFRERVREHFTPDAARILWSGCWEVDIAEGIETLSQDCLGELSQIDSAAMLRDMKNDPRLRGMLRYWINQNIVAMFNYPTVAQRSEATAALVQTAIENTP